MQIAAVLTTALLVGWLTRRSVPVAAKPVYLIDTYTYKPPDRCFRSSVNPLPILCIRDPCYSRSCRLLTRNSND